MEKSEGPRDVKDVIDAERSRGSKRRPIDREAERKLRTLAKNALKAIQDNDARAFSEELRRAGVRENSPEWNRAWKAFYDASK